MPNLTCTKHRHKSPSGSRTKTGDLRIHVAFDDVTFEEVNEGARKSNCSFSSQVRMLVEVGLETLKEA